MSATDFEHTHSAHCESGVMSTMLRHYGLNLSEPMVFGLASGLSFAYLPFVKMGGMPLIAYRNFPKSIIKNMQKNLGVKMKLETFSNKQKGEERLNELLAEGKIVGAQTSVYWLPYFPEEMRFHFNAHNLLIFAKDGDNYKISDPVFEHTVVCDREALLTSRFTKGVMAPKGLLYYPTYVPKDIDLHPIIVKSIKKVAKSMLNTPVPIAGIKGMRYLAKNITKLHKKDKRQAKLFLGHIVRMQEEIGTGGAGFRYLYASFLQESSLLFEDKSLQETSDMLMSIGDDFREFALMIAKSVKSKKEIDYKSIGEKLNSIADREVIMYKQLLEFCSKHR